MRVVYEGAVFEIMRTGGVARYFVDLINRLPAEIEPVLAAPAEIEVEFQHPRLKRHQVRTQPPLKLIRKYWRQAQHRTLQDQLSQLGGDLIHWTYYVGLCRRPVERGRVPNVITVYDFIHEAFPELDSKGENRRWQRQAIESADHLCCISETTYHELCERYPQAANRASVTLLGNTFREVQADPIPHELRDRPYVLFVGRRGGYKNFQLLWKAWKQARQRVGELALVCVGPPIKPREWKQLDGGSMPADFLPLQIVSDRQLKGLYQSSRAFVFPSRMEGFGLPALEAMECGTPVLASDCGALREVLQSAGHYFDADDADTLTEMLIAAASDSLADREAHLEHGHRRASQLTWEQTANQTAAVYHHLLADHETRRVA